MKIFSVIILIIIVFVFLPCCYDLQTRQYDIHALVAKNNPCENKLQASDFVHGYSIVKLGCDNGNYEQPFLFVKTLHYFGIISSIKHNKQIILVIIPIAFGLMCWLASKNVIFIIKKKKVIHRLQSKSKVIQIQIIKEFIQLNDLMLLEKTLYQKGWNYKEMKIKINKMRESVSWDNIYPLLEKTNGQLYDRIEKTKLLDEIEYKICCLIIAGFSTEETAAIVGIQSNKIYYNKQSIRKKIGMPPHVHFDRFFHQKFGGNSEMLQS